MASLLPQFVPSLVLQLTVVLASAAFVAWGLRRAAPLARQLVWTLAFAALYVVPVLSALPFKWRFVLESASAPAALATPESAVATALATDPAALPTAATDALDSAIEPSFDLPDMTSVCVAVYALVAALSFIRLLVGHLVVARWVRRAQPIDKVGGTVLKVRVSADVTTPVTAGVFAPVVLLPPQSAEWREECLRAVCLHEAAHVQRRDGLICVLAELALCLLWFHPLAWYAVRRLRIERELAADDFVLSSGVLPSSYAAHLLDVLRQARSGGHASIAALGMSSGCAVEQRLSRVLAPEPPRQLPSGFFPTACCAASVVVMMVACTHWEERPAMVSQTAEGPRSPRPSQHPPPRTTVSFFNQTPVMLEFSWIDYDGLERPWVSNLEPGEMYQQITTPGAIWRLRETESRRLIGTIASTTQALRVTATPDGSQKIENLGTLSMPPWQASPRPDARIDLYDATHRRFPPPFGHGMALRWTPVKAATFYQVDVSEDGGSTWQTYAADRPASHGGWINHHGHEQCGIGDLCLSSAKRYTYRVRALRADKQPLGAWSAPLSGQMPAWNRGELGTEGVTNFPRPSRMGVAAEHSSGSDTTVSLEFENAGDTTLFVYWLDFDGLEIFHARLEPGERYVQPSFAGHVFRARRMDDGVLLRELRASTSTVVELRG